VSQHSVFSRCSCISECSQCLGSFARVFVLQILDNMETISDLSYAWEILNDFLPEMHARIKGDPSAVVLLRAMFLKLTSVLDLPLARISQVSLSLSYCCGMCVRLAFLCFTVRMLRHGLCWSRQSITACSLCLHAGQVGGRH
jgi:hypothetical protein